VLLFELLGRPPQVLQLVLQRLAPLLVRRVPSRGELFTCSSSSSSNIVKQ
jgi:hypothetical protein